MTTRSVISLTEVGKTYPGFPPVEALKPCSLQIRQGDYVTIVGPSGSGKSTFMNIAGLLDRPTSGSYLLDDIDVSGLKEVDRTALRGQRIGFVFQSFHLLPYRSAVENVALAQVYSGVPRKQRREAAYEALDIVRLSHRAEALPTHLSGGERQRVAIARALVNRPSLILADEPTGNIDTRTTEHILQLFDELHADGMTMLVITHDLAVAQRGTRTIQIRDGILTEQGRAA